MTSPNIPDAAMAAIAAVLEDNRYAEPKRQLELIEAELRRLGFRSDAPTGRPTRAAASKLPAR